MERGIGVPAGKVVHRVTGGRRLLARLPLVAAVIVSVTGVWPAIAKVYHAKAAVSATALCTEVSGSTTTRWGVGYDIVSTFYGDAMKITGLTKSVNGGQATDASTLVWDLRWDFLWFGYPAPPAPPPPAGAPSFEQRSGPLTAPDGVGSVMPPVYTSPRLVTPNGSCTVYLAPFSNGTAGQPKIGVLGDELVFQLNDSTANEVPYMEGRVQRSLNAAGIRTEVEGHNRRRWTPLAGATDRARADSYLLDEYRGLLEHEPEGFVVALGVSDAMFVASAVTAAERQARWDEVSSGYVAVAGEMTQRSPCIAHVTIPENESSLDSDYHDEAVAFNNLIRFTTTVGSRADAWELVDFGAMARAHRVSDPEPWFVADNVHLNARGIEAYTGALTAAARRCADSVVLYGKADSFSGGPLSGKTSLPSGQQLRAQAVSGWGYLPGRISYSATVAGDGVVFIGNQSLNANPIFVTGDSMAISAFEPRTSAFSTIRIATDRGVDTVDYDDGRTFGFDIADLDTAPGGDAVYFTGGSGHLDGLDLTEDGMYPVFGILTKGPSGWGVAKGPLGPDGFRTWENQWSPRQLRAASDPALAEASCPLEWTQRVPGGAPNCLAYVEMAILPSGHVAVAQYFGQRHHPLDPVDHTRHRAGQITVLAVERDPAVSGKFNVRINAVFALPEVPDPVNTGYFLHPSPREVQADPTSTLGDERFALASDIFSCQGCPPPPPAGTPDPYDRRGHPAVLIEFSYHAANHGIRPVSGPTQPGGLRTETNQVAGMGTFHYDYQGNLWASVNSWPREQGIVVYAKTATGRKLSNGECPFDLSQVFTATVQPPGGLEAWGWVCPPDYQILQPRAANAFFDFEENPVTHDILVSGSQLVLIDPENPGAAGTNMSFRVANIVDPVAGLIQQEQRACRNQPNPPPTPPVQCGRIVYVDGLAVDRSGTAWLTVTQQRPGWAGTSNMDTYDQWLYSVDTAKMLGREPLRLRLGTGSVTTFQAELKNGAGAFETTNMTPGLRADVDVDSLVPLSHSGGDPVTGLCCGFVLGNETGENIPVPTGTTAEYTIVVPKPGAYQLRYRVRFPSGNTARIVRLTVDAGPAHDVTGTGTGWQTLTGPTVTFSTPGTKTIRISAPSNGWVLDWFSLTRT